MWLRWAWLHWAWLHWAIALFLVGNLSIALLRGVFPVMRGWMPGHEAIGLTVLASKLVRSGWRVIYPALRPSAATAR